MQFTQSFVTAFALAQLAAAQTTTSSSPSTTSLPELVGNVPSCALECLPKVGEEVGCSATDFECFCSDVGSFAAHMGPCLVRNKCELQDIADGSDLLTPICDVMSDSPASSDIASASSIVTAAVGEASATATSTPNMAGSFTAGRGGILAALAALIVV